MAFELPFFRPIFFPEAACHPFGAAYFFLVNPFSQYHQIFSLVCQFSSKSVLFFSPPNLHSHPHHPQPPFVQFEGDLVLRFFSGFFGAFTTPPELTVRVFWPVVKACLHSRPSPLTTTLDYLTATALKLETRLAHSYGLGLHFLRWLSPVRA